MLAHGFDARAAGDPRGHPPRQLPVAGRLPEDRDDRPGRRREVVRRPVAAVPDHGRRLAEPSARGRLSGSTPRRLPGSVPGAGSAASPMCERPRLRRGFCAMITVESLTKKYGGFTAVDDVSFTAAVRPRDRLPRPERRRQVHHHADHGRAHPRHAPAPPRSPAGGSPTCPTPGSRSACSSTPPPSTPDAPAARSSPSPSARWACPSAGCDEMLDRVSLTDSEADRRVRNYSLGMRQRLGIATALIGDPEVLILDEPANGLDPAGIRWMRDLLREYADQGGTVLLSSHLLHEIEVIADDIVVIGNGRIVAQGTKAELLEAAGTVVRTPDSRRSWPAPCSAAGVHGHHRQPTAPCAPTPTPRTSGQVALAAGVALTELAVRRRRRPGGDVPRAHRRDPARRSSSMSTDHRVVAEARACRHRPGASTRRSRCHASSVSSCARCSTPARASG